ncbi:MAG: allantoicase, partial [Caulobacterales bacterium]|nr:allantoicase [Caulobacterales bacterium]
VARLRVHGRVRAPLTPFEGRDLADLAAAENGGRAVVANDDHFGSLANIILPGRGVNMGYGWETRRRREPGHDWAILELGAPGMVAEIIVDTAHFKGNYPDRCSLQGAGEGPEDPFRLAAASTGWPVLLPEQKLEMDRAHVFTSAVRAVGPVRFVRLNILPDGGVSRLRVLGRATG